MNDDKYLMVSYVEPSVSVNYLSLTELQTIIHDKLDWMDEDAGLSAGHAGVDIEAVTQLIMTEICKKLGLLL